MIRRHVLAALAAGVEAGEDEAAREVLRHADWVLRAPAQRELSRALIDAALISGELGASDRESVRHIHRVAALNLAKRYEVDVSNRDDVAAAYSTLTAAPPHRAPVATILATSGLALAVLLLVWLAVTIRTPSRPARPIPPLVTGAYFHGGKPARDQQLEQFLSRELTNLVIETDGERHGSSSGAPRAKHSAELRDSPMITQHGPSLTTAWRGLLDSLERWVDVRSRNSEAFRAAEQDLGRRAQNVSDQFAALGLGIYLQSDVMNDRGVAHAAIFVFAVEEVVYVRAGGEPRRVLGLRRLDELNLRHTLLGRQGDELGDPVVLLDQIDEFVRDRVLPTLDGSAYPLGDDAWRSSNMGVYGGLPLAYRVGDAIRREIEPALMRDEPREAQVARIIAGSVRRHEARHGIDNDRDTPLRYPQALAAYVPNDGKPLARRAHAELAGYLSQIGNEPVTPHFALWNLASLSFNRARWHSAESYVGVIVVEGLARQLGIAQPNQVIVNDQFNRPQLARLAEQLTAQSSDKLRVAARKLWIELYGEPMLPIVDLLR
ncbi:MAG TPA: hypothetical protein VIV11_09490 [Kofleriaceae bacterium]